MGNTRRILLVGLVAFVGFMVFHAIRPWGWSAPTEPPAGIPVQNVSYTCGPPWGGSYIHGPATTTYPISGTPCGQRHDYQTIAGVDILLGLLGIAVVSLWGRLQPEPAQT